jgi:DNA-binding response OmpR family regulator
LALKDVKGLSITVGNPALARIAVRATQRILIVHGDRKVADTLAARLEAAGYRSVVETRFEDGKVHLIADPPDLLIASVHLGAYNGLHLIIRGRLDHPRMAAILTSDRPDPLFNAEAARHGAAYVAGPEAEGSLVALATRVLARDVV